MSENKDLAVIDNSILYEVIYIKNKINQFTNNSSTLNEISPYELFHLLLIGKENLYLIDFLMNHIDQIIHQRIKNFNLLDFFSIYMLQTLSFAKVKCNIVIRNVIKDRLLPETICFLKEVMNLITSTHDSIDSVFDIIVNELNIISIFGTIKSSKILIDLWQFTDFREKLKTKHPLIEFIIRKITEKFPTFEERETGYSILGKLLKTDYEYIIENWITILENINFTGDSSVELVGMGCFCLVFKIGKYVIKIGEDRITKKIFINYRILVSQFRKLYKDNRDDPLFYIETMRFVKVGDVTEEERDELVDSLAAQGIILHDRKLANCGVLLDDDDNIPNMKAGDEGVAAHIKNPHLEQEFTKRKRRVVLVDNDSTYFSPSLL